MGGVVIPETTSPSAREPVRVLDPGSSPPAAARSPR